MSIREEADSMYFLGHVEERKLAARLDEGFTVTHGRSFGDLAMWLADPKPHFRERFGFSKEILVLYSQHPRTDARVLTAVERIFAMEEFKHRIDGTVILVVHGGEQQSTEDLLRSNLEWIFVPLSARDLTDPNRGNLFLRSRIANAIGNVDLFGMSSPIKSDKYFFGRQELLQNFVVKTLKRSENLGLFGLRKTGKTSVLFALQRRLSGELSGEPVLAEYVDCQNPGVHTARWWQVLQGMIERAATTLKNEPGRNFAYSRTYSATNAGATFLNDIKTLLRVGNFKHVVFFLDEVEYITPDLSGQLGRHWDQDFVPFWQTLRAVHHESLGRMTFIVAGVNPSCVARSHFCQLPNPIFQLAQPHYLEPLDTSQIRGMIRSIGRYSGLKFQESVYSYLQEVYGGHPFLIRLACSEIWRVANPTDPTKRAEVRIASFADRRNEIRARLERPVKDILLSLVWWYPDEYDLLRILASGDISDETFVSQYLQEDSRDTSSILQFASYGLLTPDRSRFAIADLREFLQEFGDVYKRELSPFMRGDMPPEVLPEVPDLKLLGQLFEKRCEIELKLRKAIILYLSVRHNWDNAKIAQAMAKGIRPIKHRPSGGVELFVGRTPQEVINNTFTADLKAIIVENWDIFNPLFESNKIRFEMNMDTLNRARRVDAHARPIDQSEIDDISNSYGWLKNRLANIQLPV